MRALVTGCNGFIGRHLVAALRARGDVVTGVDRHVLRESGCDTFYWSQLETLNLDVLVKDQDVVFHLAATPGVQPSWTNFQPYVDDNIRVTQRLLAACHAAQQPPAVVFASSSSVYSMLSPYAASKAAGEALCQVYRNAGLRVISARLFTVFGPGQRPDMAFAKWFAAIRAGEPLVVYGAPSRDFTYVTDTVEELIRLAVSERWGAIVDVGYANPVRVDEVIRHMAMVTGHDDLYLRWVGPRQGDAIETRADHAIMRLVSLDDGLRKQWEAV